MPSVVHRNFKSANILLDDEFNPHLSDCGLAALNPNTERQVKRIEVTAYTVVCFISMVGKPFSCEDILASVLDKIMFYIWKLGLPFGSTFTNHDELKNVLIKEQGYATLHSITPMPVSSSHRGEVWGCQQKGCF